MYIDRSLKIEISETFLAFVNTNALNLEPPLLSPFTKILSLKRFRPQLHAMNDAFMLCEQFLIFDSGAFSITLK